MKNESGIVPVEFKALIFPKPVEEKKGSIILPDMVKDHEKFSGTEGTLVAVAPAAFTYITDEEWRGSKPKPGDKVIFAKFAGLRLKGKDGQEYVLVNDKDVVATVNEA